VASAAPTAPANAPIHPWFREKSNGAAAMWSSTRRIPHRTMRTGSSSMVPGMLTTNGRWMTMGV
jgi:hypothetical protein